MCVDEREASYVYYYESHTQPSESLKPCKKLSRVVLSQSCREPILRALATKATGWLVGLLLHGWMTCVVGLSHPFEFDNECSLS